MHRIHRVVATGVVCTLCPIVFVIVVTDVHKIRKACLEGGVALSALV